MQKTTLPSRWIEEVQRIYFCWEHYWQFAKSPVSQVSGTWWTLCFISICKFGSFKNALATITSLLELYFKFRRSILLVQTRKVISMNFGRRTSSWKPWRWVRLDLILTIMDIFISSNLNPLTDSLAAAEALSLKIFSHGTSLKWSRRPSQSATE